MADSVLDATGSAPSPLGELRAAVGFLTRIPVAVTAGEAATTGAAAFPLVGAGIGAVAAIPLIVLGGAHPLVAAVVAVAIVGIVDGGLHLDGLADTVDALAAPMGAAERARTDPRAGSAGVAAIAMVLGLEVAALAEIAGRGPGASVVALVVAGSSSRALAPLLGVVASRRAPATGLGRWFADRVGPAGALLALILAVGPLAAAAGVGFGRLSAGAAASALLALAVTLVVVRARGQLDGDGYGFAIETTFALVLTGAALVA